LYWRIIINPYNNHHPTELSASCFSIINITNMNVKNNVQWKFILTSDGICNKLYINNKVVTKYRDAFITLAADFKVELYPLHMHAFQLNYFPAYII